MSTKQAQKGHAPQQRQDGRILLTTDDFSAAAEAMAKRARDPWLKEHLHTRTRLPDEPEVHSLYETACIELLQIALRAINQARCGHPEGAICYHKATGQMAKRVWSDGLGHLVWTIVTVTGDQPAEISDVDDLASIDGQPWTIAEESLWPTSAPEAAVVEES